MAGFLAFPGVEPTVAPGPTASIGDWHLTVLDVTTDTSAGISYPVPADGTFHIVTVNVIGTGRFDAHLVDASGRAWPRARDVEPLLGPGPRRLVFDVGSADDAPVLVVRRPGHRTAVEVPLSR